MGTKREKMKNFLHISDLLGQTLASYRQEADGELVRIWHLWPEAVGPAIAENARPAAFKGHLLIVHVTSPTWIQHLQFLKKEIIRNVNGALERPLVGDIRFRVGDV